MRGDVSELTERSAPRESVSGVARFGPGTKVPISCYVTGEDVHGNTTWYRVRAENEFRTVAPTGLCRGPAAGGSP
ncbi:hypothetical protein GCM10012287_17000 [Streptomyces daqingensis]|uniref:Ig-like domain-containing protein n=1 Tax=Streptomyces daqingensis TaxID=1472640 RepID=A0ABQ2M442_9ACTN|nr:hypothetical protein GCM10012287_17000 [Streptomyces daqingensis]